MTPRESVIAVLVRHAEWCLDQADPEVVRDLPAWQREHALGVAAEIAVVVARLGGADESGSIRARIGASEWRRLRGVWKPAEGEVEALLDELEGRA